MDNILTFKFDNKLIDYNIKVNTKSILFNSFAIIY